METVAKPRSIKIPADFDEELRNYLWAKRLQFSGHVIHLLQEDIKNNPLSASEKKDLKARLEAEANRKKKA